MRPPPDRQPPSVRRWARLGGAAGALTLALIALFSWRSAERDRAALLAQAGDLLVPAEALDDLRRALAREVDPARRRLLVARALVAHSVRRSDDPRSDRHALAALETARELARAASADLRGSWEAAMVEGATTALLRLGARDTRLFSEHRAWEEPLRRAETLAPAAPEPRRYLAASYIEVWPALSREKRERVEPLLERAFRDPFVFERMLPRWIEVHSTLDDAARLLPDAPRTWARLFDVAARRADLPAARRFWLRQRRSLASELDRLLTPAAAAARPDALVGAVVAAPVDLEFAPLVERGVALRPPGPVPPTLARALATWTEWALPLCLLRDCPFGAAFFDRIAAPVGGALPPPLAAFASLAAGDRPRAERLARRSEALWSEPWAPFVLFAARDHLAAGEGERACRELATVHASFRRSPAWTVVARSCPALRSRIEEPIARERWPAYGWGSWNGQPRLELVADRPAKSLLLRLREPPTRPALLLAQWDGRELEPLALTPGATAVSIPVEVTPGPHVLRLETKVGARPAWDVIELAGAASRRPTPAPGTRESSDAAPPAGPR